MAWVLHLLERLVAWARRQRDDWRTLRAEINQYRAEHRED